MNKKILYGLLVFVFLWRIALHIPLLYGEHSLQYNTKEDYTRIWGFTEPYSPVDSFLLYPYANFDGVHYLSIAAKGYENNGRFLPLYPLSIGFLASLFHGTKPYDATYFFTAFFLTQIIFGAALYFLYKLLRINYNESVAAQTIFFFLLFPTSFFFISFYTEGLFLLLSVLSFYFIEKKSLYKAALCVFLLSLTRIVGIAFFPILLFAFMKEKYIFTHIQKKNYAAITRVLPSFLPILLVPTGLVLYALFCFKKWGNALYFLSAHTQIGNNRSDHVVLFPQTMFRYIKILLSLPPLQYAWSIAFLELSSFIFSLLLLFVGWKKGVSRNYLIFALFCILIPSSSGTFSGLPRYILPLFPLFLSISLIDNKLVKILYSVIGSILLFFCFMYFSKGYYIA